MRGLAMVLLIYECAPGAPGTAAPASSPISRWPAFALVLPSRHSFRDSEFNWVLSRQSSLQHQLARLAGRGPCLRLARSKKRYVPVGSGIQCFGVCLGPN